MSLNNINIRNWVLVLMILAAVSTRFFSLGEQSAWSNFTPVGAIAMFGGTYFADRYKAYLVPLLILFISDVFITYTYTGEWTLFYEGFALVYICFAAMVFIGTLIKKVNINTVLIGSLTGVLIHWLITDIEPWLRGTMYNKDITGYYQSLVAAIPFERNMLLGNLLFGAVLYGGFELAKSKFSVLKSRSEIVL
jgi:hypothetical protein